MNKYKYLISFFVILIIIGGIVIYGIPGENFLGMIKYSDSVEIVTEDVSSVFKNNELTPISENSFSSQFTSQNFEYAEFKTTWAPGKYREESDKALIKVYPFSTILYSDTIKDIAFNALKKWRNVGIQGVGVVTSVDYSKQNQDHLLMGTEASGLYRSLDFGEVWTKLTNFPTYRVSRVAIDPNNENHYLAIGDWLYLYESYDAGNNWVLKKELYSLGTVAQDLQWNGNIIFARSAGSGAISFDNGQNWTNIVLPFADGGYLKIRNNGIGSAIAPNDENSTGDNAFYMTSDFGQNWTLKFSSDADNKISAFDISQDGSTIVVAKYNENLNQLVFDKSFDGGVNWQSVVCTNPSFEQYWPQDILLDDENPDHFVIFIYSKFQSIYSTNDGGVTLSIGEENIDEIDSVPIRFPSDQSAFVVTTNDLRFNHMIKITETVFSSKLDLPQVIKTSVLNEDIFKKLERFNYEPPGITINKYLLPTDQGLFVYNEETRQLKNIAKNIYLGDTGKVVVTSCPRVYTGLWHVGFFFINHDNTVWGYRTSEKGGATAGEDLGCNTPIMYSQGMYAPDGVNIDYDVSTWIWNSLNISQIGTMLFEYHDGWWYAELNNNIYRINVSNREIEHYPLPANNIFHAFDIELNINSQPTYWVVLQDPGSVELSLWRSSDLQNWNLFEEINALNEIIYNEDILINNENMNYRAVVKPDFLEINGPQILLSGFSVAVSNDYGNTWNQDFNYAYASEIISDDQGRLFVGLLAAPSVANFIQGKEMSGVWYSVDYGITWNILEPEVAKSWISGLALDKNNNVLYAATKGESLLQFNLDDYNLPMPPQVLPIFSEIELDYKPLELNRF